MSLELYDKALYNKIHELFDNVINSDDSKALSEAYRSDSDTKEDTSEVNPSSIVRFPLISFWRTGNPPNLETDGNYVQVLKGKYHNKYQNVSQAFRTFPVNISYQITIWSDTRREVDEIYREFCMLFFVDEPFLRIRIADEEFIDDSGNPTRFLVDEEFSLILTDSSTEIDTTSFSDRGRMYRQDIMIEIPNAKMFYLGKEKKELSNDSLSLTIDLGN